jgi:hypothetical protein
MIVKLLKIKKKKDRLMIMKKKTKQSYKVIIFKNLDEFIDV